MMYKNKLNFMSGDLAHVAKDKVQDRYAGVSFGGRLILKGGRIVDPGNDRDEIGDLAVLDGTVYQAGGFIMPETGDRVIDCGGLIVMPGLIDMHLHLGVYLGAANVLGTRMTAEELTAMFQGRADAAVLSEKMTRNAVTNTTANLVVGIKDHMGHFIMPDESIEKIYEITSKAGLLYMSHTQDPEHAERMAGLSKGRPLHLAHATAAGCKTHCGSEEGMQRVLKLIDGEQITGEFVTTMLRTGLGSREGLQMTKSSQRLAYDALSEGRVDILVSDGQNQGTMKGFGDTRDNIPAILELSEMGVLSLSRAVAAMTCNPARLLAGRTKNSWWKEKMGHLGAGALANITVVDPEDKLAAYTIVNGEIVSFENRIVRRGLGAGGWLCKFGMVRKTGVGDLSMYSYVR